MQSGVKKSILVLMNAIPQEAAGIALKVLIE
jgi:hypothetical protein